MAIPKTLDRLRKLLVESYGFTAQDAMIQANKMGAWSSERIQSYLQNLDEGLWQRNYRASLRSELTDPASPSRGVSPQKRLEPELPTRPAVTPRSEVGDPLSPSRGMSPRARVPEVPGVIPGAATRLPPNYLNSLRQGIGRGVKGLGAAEGVVGLGAMLTNLSPYLMAAWFAKDLMGMWMESHDRKRAFDFEKDKLKNQMLADAQALSYESNREAIQRREATAERANQKLIADKLEQALRDQRRLSVLSSLMRPGLELQAVGSIPLAGAPPMTGSTAAHMSTAASIQSADPLDVLGLR